MLFSIFPLAALYRASWAKPLPHVVFQHTAHIARQGGYADEVYLYGTALLTALFAANQCGLAQIKAAFEGFVGVVAEPRINRAVDKLRGNAEQEQAGQYGDQREHPGKAFGNLRTEHAVAPVFQQQYDITCQNGGQHQQQHCAERDYPPEIIRQRTGAAGCRRQSVQQDDGAYGCDR